MIKTVLCIDDDEMSLMLSEAVLQKAEFADKIFKAEHGKEGLAWFSQYFIDKRNGVQRYEPPSIIFLDLEMPVMNGWRFLEEFIMKYADRLPATKVVIVSSTINPEDFAKARKYKKVVLDFIHKPLSNDGLENLMENEELAIHFPVHG